MLCDGDAAHRRMVRRAARCRRAAAGVRGKAPMNGKYAGYVAGEHPLHAFLSKSMRDRLEVREPQLAFRVFRLSGSNEVYAYEEKLSGAKAICKFYGTRFGPDLDKAAGMARQEYEGLKTLRRFNLVGSPHHVIRPLGLSRDINLRDSPLFAGGVVMVPSWGFELRFCDRWLAGAGFGRAPDGWAVTVGAGSHGRTRWGRRTAVPPCGCRRGRFSGEERPGSGRLRGSDTDVTLRQERSSSCRIRAGTMR